MLRTECGPTEHCGHPGVSRSFYHLYPAARDARHVPSRTGPRRQSERTNDAPELTSPGPYRNLGGVGNACHTRAPCVGNACSSGGQTCHGRRSGRTCAARKSPLLRKSSFSSNARFRVRQKRTRAKRNMSVKYFIKTTSHTTNELVKKVLICDKKFTTQCLLAYFIVNILMLLRRCFILISIGPLFQNESKLV